MLIKHNGKYYRDKTEITAEQYDEIQIMLRNRPTAPEGYGYRLTEDLQWELYELPPVEVEEDPELSAEEVLDIIVNGDDANETK
jgi:hypothetical protein